MDSTKESWPARSTTGSVMSSAHPHGFHDPSAGDDAASFDFLAAIEHDSDGASILDFDAGHTASQFEPPPSSRNRANEMLENNSNAAKWAGESFEKILRNMMQNWPNPMSFS